MKVLETDDLVLLTDVLALETDIFFKLFPRHGILHFVTLFTEDSGLLKMDSNWCLATCSGKHKVLKTDMKHFVAFSVYKSASSSFSS